jgi:hypothetical protein
LKRRELEEKATEKARARAMRLGEEQIRLAAEAAEAARRRKEEEKAAEAARKEARDWTKIRDRLQREAEEASRQRERGEREVLKAVEDVRRLEQKEEEPPKKMFSFQLGSQDWFGGSAEKEEVKTVEPQPVSQPEKSSNFGWFRGQDNQRQEPTSSWSSSRVPITNPKPEKNWITSFFDFFRFDSELDDEDIEQMPGRGTVRIVEEPKQKSVFDFFVKPEALAEAPPGRGTIRIEENPKPSFFSFFAGQPRQRATAPVSKPPTNSMFSFLEPKKEPPPPPVEPAKKSSMFSFFGDGADLFFGSTTENPSTQVRPTL